MGDTQTTRSWLDMDPQSSLDEFLTGKETRILSGEAEARIRQKEAQIQSMEDRLASGRGAGDQLPYRISRARREIEQIRDDSQNFDTVRRGGYLEGSFKNLLQMAESEENIGDITRGRQAQLDLANYLSQLQAPDAPELMGPMPGQEQIGYAQGFAEDIFAPQQNQLNQLFQDQRMQANRAAAIQGRAGNDPITLARLAQEQARQQSQLGSQQTALAAQTARSLPSEFNQIAQQRYQNQLGNLLQNIQFRAQGAQALQDLGQQALRNRISVLGIGQALAGSERQFRLATAAQNQKTQQNPGALSIAGGALGAAGTIANIASGFGGSAALGQIAGGTGGGGMMAPTLQKPQFGQSYQPASQTFSLNWRE